MYLEMEILCRAAFGEDEYGAFLDEASALAKQRQPEVLYLERRLFIEQRLAVDGPRNHDSLLAAVRTVSG